MNHGARARLAWYCRRLRGGPAHVFAVDPANGSFISAALDPRPPWRKPKPQGMSGWRHVGYTTNEPPVAFRRGMHLDPRQIPTDLKQPSMDAGHPPEVFREERQ